MMNEKDNIQTVSASEIKELDDLKLGNVHGGGKSYEENWAYFSDLMPGIATADDELLGHYQALCDFYTRHGDKIDSYDWETILVIGAVRPYEALLAAAENYVYSDISEFHESASTPGVRLDG